MFFLKDLEIKRNNVVLEKVDNLKHKDSLSLRANSALRKADIDKPLETVDKSPNENEKSSKVTGRQLTSNKKGITACMF